MRYTCNICKYLLRYADIAIERVRERERETEMERKREKERERERDKDRARERERERASGNMGARFFMLLSQTHQEIQLIMTSTQTVTIKFSHGSFFRTAGRWDLWAYQTSCSLPGVPL